MRKALPRMPESAAELQRRLQSARAPKKRQRLPALYRAARGHARHRRGRAALRGGQRHRVAAWLRASAQGGVEQARRYPRPLPPVHQRIPATALAALQETLQAPPGCAGYRPRQGWLAEEPPVS